MLSLSDQQELARFAIQTSPLAKRYSDQNFLAPNPESHKKERFEDFPVHLNQGHGQVPASNFMDAQCTIPCF